MSTTSYCGLLHTPPRPNRSLGKHQSRTSAYWPSTTSSRRPVRMGHSRRGMPPACPNLRTKVRWGTHHGVTYTCVQPSAGPNLQVGNPAYAGSSCTPANSNSTSAPEDAGERLVQVLLVSVAVPRHILPHLRLADTTHGIVRSTKTSEWCSCEPSLQSIRIQPCCSHRLPPPASGCLWPGCRAAAAPQACSCGGQKGPCYYCCCCCCCCSAPVAAAAAVLLLLGRWLLLHTVCEQPQASFRPTSSPAARNSKKQAICPLTCRAPASAARS